MNKPDEISHWIRDESPVTFHPRLGYVQVKDSYTFLLVEDHRHA